MLPSLELTATYDQSKGGILFSYVLYLQCPDDTEAVPWILQFPLVSPRKILVPYYYHPVCRTDYRFDLDVFEQLSFFVLFLIGGNCHQRVAAQAFERVSSSGKIMPFASHLDFNTYPFRAKEVNSSF